MQPVGYTCGKAMSAMSVCVGECHAVSLPPHARQLCAVKGGERWAAGYFSHCRAAFLQCKALLG